MPEVIPASRVRLAVKFLFLLIVLAVVLAGLYLIPFAALGIGLFQAGAIRLGFLSILFGLGLAGMAFSWLAVLGQLGYDLAFPQALILDETEFRHVRRGRTGDRIKAAFPYSNIANVRTAKAKMRLPLSITLHDPNEPNTVLADEDRRKAGLNRPIRLPAGWTVPVAEIAERLKARCRNLGPKTVSPGETNG